MLHFTRLNNEDGSFIVKSGRNEEVAIIVGEVGVQRSLNREFIVEGHFLQLRNVINILVIILVDLLSVCSNLCHEERGFTNTHSRIGILLHVVNLRQKS